ncbi:hypothetical protein [Gramella sp. AN32]|uniref:Uncharacterized protein n=1 Tax=Christiangramia antarctica TaxID=2058158 RepID=A0ABW5X3A6_9FLAO|nr:hypothetical protein [Gramella sp. AN32]MCM4158133.1 hypothetical protein [Gramella sp. AN32]
MKLLIITALAEFQKDVLRILKEAKIEAFSSSEIDGYKNSNSFIAAQSWFPGERSGNESMLFFSFTEEELITPLLELTKEYNKNLPTNNPVRIVVLGIEQFI